MVRKLTCVNRKFYAMFGLSITRSKATPKSKKYFKCGRCGYISIVKDGTCPICVKDGFTIKMK